MTVRLALIFFLQNYKQIFFLSFLFIIYLTNYFTVATLANNIAAGSGRALNYMMGINVIPTIQSSTTSNVIQMHHY